MRIVADEQIWGVPGIFEPFGAVRTRSGREIGRADVAEADALVVRSVTRVDATLLDGTPVRFVGSATSGTDHIDRAYLSRRGITFVDAAGCNARTVAEYVLTALLVIAEREGFLLADRTLGVVGVGQIGSRVAAWAEALGMRVLRCDPPLVRAGRDGADVRGFVPFEALAERADCVTLHVPLTFDGPDRTAGMVDAAWLGRLGPGTVLVNTSRGGVVDEAALVGAIDRGRLGPVILDVWRNEPRIDRGLLERVALGTPHIAGYSADAGRRGAEAIGRGLSKFTGVVLDSAPARAVPEGADFAGAIGDHAAQRDLCRICAGACDVEGIDRAFRAQPDGPGFDALRGNVKTSKRRNVETSKRQNVETSKRQNVKTSKPKTESRKPKAEDRKPKAESRKPKTEN